MPFRKSFKVTCGVSAVVLAIIGLAACGGSSSKPTASGLDPANKMPASVVAYASLTVRPQGSVRNDLVQAVDELAGKGTFNRLDSDITRGIRRGHGQPAALASWLGQRVGVALTAMPTNLQNIQQQLKNSLVVVAPTSNPAAARGYLSKQISKQKLSGGITWKVQGNYVILGGSAGVAAALKTSSKNSLAGNAAYDSAVGKLDSGQLATVYVRERPLLQAIAPLMGQLPGQRASVADTLSKMPDTQSITLGFGVGSKSFRLDVVSNGAAPGAATATGAGESVATLPADSWLALSLGGLLSKPAGVAELSKGLALPFSLIEARAGLPGGRPPAIFDFIQNDVLPALGPMSVSIGGSSLASLKAGVVLSPLNAAAGKRLAGALTRMVAGLPVKVSHPNGKVVVTYGYPSVQALLSPSSTLASDPAYKAAAAQLPSGTKSVPIYLSFGPLAMLGSTLDGKPSDAKVWKVAGKLSYLIAGGAKGHFRMVLALK